MILFVHGMGYNSDRSYWKEWAAPLREELARQNLPLREDQFDGVYYYDLVPGPKIGQVPKDDICQIQIAGLKNNVIRELGAYRASYVKEMGLIGNLSDYVVDNFGDIFTYLYWEDTHRKVNERLYEAIDKNIQPVHLIGYSLGSIVSLCALMQNQAIAGKVSHLLLLGSPLFWFKQGVAKHVDLCSKPPVERFTNLSAIADIAWPHMVPQLLPALDYNVEFVINPHNPIKGHQGYFYKDASLQAIASEIIKGWGKTNDK